VKLQDAAKLLEIGTLLDQAMEAIERENPSLIGVLSSTATSPIRKLAGPTR
jgi:hypothetical protein